MRNRVEGDDMQLVIRVDGRSIRKVLLGLAGAALAAGLVYPLVVDGATVATMTTFTAGTPIRASEVNANFAALKASIDDSSARVGDLTALQTATKTSVVDALNEMKAAAGGGGATQAWGNYTVRRGDDQYTVGIVSGQRAIVISDARTGAEKQAIPIIGSFPTSPYLAGINDQNGLIAVWWNGTDERFGSVDLASGTFTDLGPVGDLKYWQTKLQLVGNTLFVEGGGPKPTGGQYWKVYILDTVSGALLREVITQ
jgi:hypothetical protein